MLSKFENEINLSPPHFLSHVTFEFYFYGPGSRNTIKLQWRWHRSNFVILFSIIPIIFTTFANLLIDQFAN